jgi:hypothetical protein
MVTLRLYRRGLLPDLGRDRIDTPRHGERRRKDASCRGGRNKPQRIGYGDITVDGGCRGRVDSATDEHHDDDDDDHDDHPNDHDDDNSDGR